MWRSPPMGAGSQILLHFSRLEHTPLLPVVVSPPEKATVRTTEAPSPEPEASTDPLQRYVQDLSRLGIRSQEDLNQPTRRREYVRWLIQANNRLFADLPSRQVRPARPQQAPRFKDVPANDPDFTFIQGAADAGLLPTSGQQFFPDRPLTREQLVQWKILLDLRRPLPPISAAELRKITGFVDSSRIAAAARSAIAADMQLGDLSNLRRSFGFRVQLQPQQAVTRLESLASLWSFGTAIDGRSAAQVRAPE
ncbi:MAG: S-layer homology domain-containing protein [Oscillatoriales cyanobacterium SM2_2_1]|nr:S-layer homology domain-containing protein [Oscillatoriales cyanobacterium SM2_2_1]